jgi:alpha-beta hydrolase superfamily lysophospholipase
MKAFSRIVLAALAVFLIAAAQPAAAARGQVYLLRGGLNIFSTGMDEIAGKLRAKGVDAQSLGHADWQKVVDAAAARYRKSKAPIVLVGHSWGANAEILVADALLRKDIPVALIVMLDPTTVLKAPANVKRLINYYSTTAKGQNLQVLPGFGFRGSLENTFEPVGHLDIDNWPPLQNKIIAQIVQVAGGK